jgi:hypothetical protein
MEKHGFDLKTTGRRAVEEVPYGMYVWEIELDGETQVLGDGDGNVMNVFCMKGDKRAIRALADAARSYGYPDGKPVWWSGKRRINDEELQEQQMREKLGLNPDPMDYAALMDELKAQRHGG